MECSIRKMLPSEYYLLDDYLYLAIFIPKGVAPPPKDIIYNPELQVYVKDFGKRKGDTALVAEIKGTIVGVVWARIMNDYGHIDNDTPSLAISVRNEYRGKGIGTRLLQNILTVLKQQGYTQTSLAVQKENYAVKLYESVGFVVVGENTQEYIMRCEL